MSSNEISNNVDPISFGVYGTLIGYNLSLSISSDGTFQISSSPQVSAGISVGGNIPIFTTNILGPFGEINYGPNNINAQPSAWVGIGTPSGLPGPTASILKNVNASQIQFQIGFGISNDIGEIGISLALPTGWLSSSPTSNYSNEGHNYPTYNSSNPQDVFTPPMAIINGTAVNLETATIVMDVATGHLSWTDINVLAAEYRSSDLTDPLAYATELAEHSPPEIDALDVFFSAYEAATSSTPSTPDSKSSSSSSSDSSDNYSGTTSESLSYAYGGGGWYPIVIDMDGDGVEIKPLTTSNTFFDADNDGYAERTAWAGADDGILMIDLGGDGKVTDAKEIAFGNWTPQDDTDLQALATVFDSNADGVFDARDARFGEFRLWNDANGNGEVDSGELQTLEQAGVRSMDLKVKDGTALDLGEGTKVHGLFKVELTNGKTVDGADVTFGYSATGVRKGVDASGNTTYVLETGDVYKHRVLGTTERNVVLTDSTTDGVNWLGATGNALNNLLDARTALADMALDGGDGNDTLLGGAGNDLLRGGAGTDVLRAGKGDDVLLADSADVLAALQSATPLQAVDGGEGYDQLLVEGDTALTLNLDKLNVEAVVTGAGADNLTGEKDTVDYVLNAGAGNDTLVTAGGNDVLLGGDGNDKLDAGAGNDRLLGGAGADTLRGGDGADVLAGGQGNDVLEGGAGDDVYYYERGDGKDTIRDVATEEYTYDVKVAYQYEAAVKRKSGKNSYWVNELRTGYRTETREGVHEIDGGIDTLLFGTGISVEDLVLSRSGNHMVVQLRDASNESVLTADQITLADWADQDNRIENFAFADGTKLDFSQITQAAYGMGENDTLTGSAEGDFLSGGAGSDTLSGGAGKDVLVGGSGNDKLSGGADHDFLFAGKGNDSLQGGDGRDYLLGGAGNDTLDGGNADDVLAGEDGADTLRGGLGNDLLLGGTGADVLQGGGGDDNYFYFRGDGRDEIYDHLEEQQQYNVQVYVGQRYQRSGKNGRWVSEYRTESRTRTVQLDGGNDRLEFGLGIALEDLFIQTQGNDLVVGLRDGTTALSQLEDQILIRSWSNVMNRIETFGLSDGLQMDMSEILHARSGLDGDDTFTGTANGDFLSGGAGNDVLKSLAGNDILAGGAGADTLEGGDGEDDLYGGDGADTLVGGAGLDYVHGGAGDDLLDCGDGNDVLVGGAGNDTLKGGRGDDVYIFNRGDGADRIDETGTETVQETYTYEVPVLKTIKLGGKWASSYSTQVWVNETRTGHRTVTRAIDGGNDTLQFGYGIDIDDLLLSSTGNDLVIDVLLDGKATEDAVSISGWNTPEFRIETLRFANDFAIDISEIAGATKGTAQDDSLTATDESTWLSGQAGNDNLTGSSHADVLHGGKGGDTLKGGQGDDVYIFAKGDGKDVIYDSGSSAVGTDKQKPGGDKLLFGAGLSIDDVVLERQGNDMVIYLRDRDAYDKPLTTVADLVRVQNWNSTGQRIEVLQFVDGTDFDISSITSTYLGTSGQTTADTLIGSTQADWINGFGGDDQITAQAGNDYVFGEAGNDRIDAGAGDDIVSGGAGNDTIHGGTGGDLMAGGEGDDQLYGQQDNDVLFGGQGNDRIDGGDGDDYIIGDQGNDTYIASKGTDIYRFGFGDGQDTYIGSNQAGIVGTDVIMLEDDVSKDRLWFTRSGDDLYMKILGTEDQICFQGWYSGSTPSRHVLGFQSGEDVLTYNKVQELVNAMAAFTPNDGTTAYGVRAGDLPQTLSTTINSTWVHA